MLYSFIAVIISNTVIKVWIKKCVHCTCCFSVLCIIHKYSSFHLELEHYTTSIFLSLRKGNNFDFYKH